MQFDKKKKNSINEQLPLT